MPLLQVIAQVDEDLSFEERAGLCQRGRERVIVILSRSRRSCGCLSTSVGRKGVRRSRGRRGSDGCRRGGRVGRGNGWSDQSKFDCESLPKEEFVAVVRGEGNGIEKEAFGCIYQSLGASTSGINAGQRQRGVHTLEIGSSRDRNIPMYNRSECM